MKEQIRVFVASSSEQISTAEGIARSLSGTPELDVQVWNKGVFDFSASYMESLEKALEQADFAAVVLTADDRAEVRSQIVELPRATSISSSVCLLAVWGGSVAFSSSMVHRGLALPRTSQELSP